MASARRALGPRIALAAALLLSACQHDSTADFDNTSFSNAGSGGTGSTEPGAAGAMAGDEPGGSSAAGGSDANGGSASAGKAGGGGAGKAGTSAGGKAGADAGGKAGTSAGGKAGTDAGGSSSGAGKGGSAGSTSGAGGSAGSANPDPITLETNDIDDAHVASCFPNLNFGEAVSIDIDGDASCKYETLIDAPRTQLPDGAVVSKATLTLTCINPGDAVTVAYVDQAWSELMVRWNNRPDVGATLGTITCEKVGEVSIDLTAAFQAWVGGTHAEHGIYLRSQLTDGTDFASSEAVNVSERPKLTITYTLP